MCACSIWELNTDQSRELQSQLKPVSLVQFHAGVWGLAYWSLDDSQAATSLKSLIKAAARGL